jgi:hypothetical protein
MRKYLVIAFNFSGFVAFAQESYVYFAWDVNTPISNTAWIGSTSTRGARIGYRHFIGASRRFSVGLDVNWAYFQEYKPTETFQTQGGAITTDYFNEIFQLGIAGSAQYYFQVGEAQRIFPYAGLGLGAGRNDYSVYYNIYEDQESQWGFQARPEAGVLVRIGERRRFALSAAIHYDFSTARSQRYNYDSFSTWGFHLGGALLRW